MSPVGQCYSVEVFNCHVLQGVDGKIATSNWALAQIIGLAKANKINNYCLPTSAAADVAIKIEVLN